MKARIEVSELPETAVTNAADQTASVAATGARRFRVCFISGGLYSHPLDQTVARKFRALEAVADAFVIGFSDRGGPYRFSEHAKFFLLPRISARLARSLMKTVAECGIGLWCVLRHRVEILVAKSPYEGLAATFVKVLCRALGRPVGLVVESHGNFEIVTVMQHRVSMPGLYGRWMAKAARLSIRQADALRAVSSATRRQLATWAPDTPLVQFPGWTDMEPFLKSGAEAQGRARDARVLFVGSLVPQKGLPVLLDAFAEVARDEANARLSIVGSTEDGRYRSELEKRVHALGIEDRVSFSPWVPQRMLAEHMAEARVLVLPSLSEGLGRVVFEAMACGTAVIGSRVDGIPDLIEDGVTGLLVTPGDRSGLAKAMRAMLQRPDEARAMGWRGREFATRFFSAEQYVQHYARLFAYARAAYERS